MDTQRSFQLRWMPAAFLTSRVSGRWTTPACSTLAAKVASNPETDDGTLARLRLQLTPRIREGDFSSLEGAHRLLLPEVPSRSLSAGEEDQVANSKIQEEGCHRVLLLTWVVVVGRDQLVLVILVEGQALGAHVGLDAGEADLALGLLRFELVHRLAGGHVVELDRLRVGVEVRRH